MEFFYIEILLGLVLTLCLIIYLKTRRPRNYPPGPPRLPFIGNLHQLSDEPQKDFMEFRKKYGDVISIDYGAYQAVVINDYKLIKEAFALNEFSGRPLLEALKERGGGKMRGVIFVDGQTSVHQRRFALKTLRDFGFGKQSMEGLIHEEIGDLIQGLKQLVDTPISTKNKLNAAVLNTLWSIVTGERYAHTDPKLADIIKIITIGFERRRSFGLSHFFPGLRKLIPLRFIDKSAQKRIESYRSRMSFVLESVERHQRTFQSNSVPRDFIDCYLEEIQQTTDPTSSFYGEEGERNLGVVLMDLLTAGLETTSTTLAWTFLLLALHQESQNKLFHEIKEIIGLSRLPSLKDRPQMPYTQAVILEVMRFIPLVPLGVQHRTTTDVEFHGFRIPGNTVIIANLYCAMKDENYWGDPDNFRPERFLSADGSTLLYHDAFMPFATGKRACLGETLARNQLFLFVTSLFQTFSVETDPYSPKPKIEYYTTVLLPPKPHTLVLRNRIVGNQN